MSKIEITDEMVERAAAAGWYVKDGAPHPARVDEAIKTTARRVLEAALNEPEIPVTPEMVSAGWVQWCYRTPQGDALHGQLANIYRAMRKLEPKQ